jgi:hypothetical protein
MEIQVRCEQGWASERLRTYASAMTREVLRGLDDLVTHVELELRREEGRYGQRRFVCTVRAQTEHSGTLVFDAGAPYPHVAVERSLEQFWSVLRSESARERIFAA